jgi:hypothetical protein
MSRKKPCNPCNPRSAWFFYACIATNPIRAEKDNALKHTNQSLSGPSFHLRGCRVSAPIQQPWGGGCRIVEWIDAEGQISRRVVAEDVTEDEVVATIRRHVKGRKHVLVDDEGLPRQTLPRR